jgi:hypothetical protein
MQNKSTDTYLTYDCEKRQELVSEELPMRADVLSIKHEN